MSRIYLTEHHTHQNGRVGLVQIHAETWEAAERDHQETRVVARVR